VRASSTLALSIFSAPTNSRAHCARSSALVDALPSELLGAMLITLWRVLLLLILVFVSPAVRAIEPGRSLADLVHDTWTVDNGLPQSTILDIARTQDGYLWFATHEGAARFDGRQFAVFNEANAPLLRGSGISALLEAKDGSLYLGLREGGLVRYYGGVFAAITPTGGLPKGTISALAEDAAGTIWVGSSGGGTARIVKGAARFFTAAEGLPNNTVTSIRVTASGDVWIGTFGGLGVVRGNVVIAQPTGDKLDKTFIASLFEDRQRRLWIATYGEGLYQWDSGKLKHFTRKDGLSSDTVNRVHEDKDGALWLGSLEGLQRWHGDNFESFSSVDGLTNKFVRDIVEDAEGSIWVGTDRGIDRFREGVISTIGIRHGLSEEFTRTVLEDSKGNLWVGTADGLFEFQNSNYQNADYKNADHKNADHKNTNGAAAKVGAKPIRYTTVDGLANNAILSLAEGAGGVIWVGGNAGGLHRISGGKVENLGAKFGIGAASVRTVLETRDGGLWVGTNAGLFYRSADRKDKINNNDSGNVTQFGVAEGLASEQVTSLFEDRKSILWVGTRDGLSRIDLSADVRRLLPRTDNFAVGGGVLSINADVDGHLLVATSSGLATMRADRLLTLRAEHGVPPRTYFNVVDDGKGSLWLCSNQGLVRILKAEIGQLLDNNRLRLEPTLYGRSEGMATAQCNGGSGPAAWRTRDGRLLFATARGIAVVAPSTTTKLVPLPPPVLIQDVDVDSIPIAFREGVQLVPGPHRLEISYVALNLSDPDRVRYRYRLNGFDKQWVEAGTSRKAVYTNIEPGAYQFEVVASNRGGEWQEQGAIMHVAHRAYAWNTNWFRAMVALIMMGGVFVFFRLRVARLRRKARHLSALVEERTQDLALQKDQLERANDEKARLLSQVQEKSEAYERLSKEDGLTGLANRREFDRLLMAESARAMRTQRPLSVVLADVDYFKRVNDGFGHAVGDEVLRIIAQLLRGGSRELDRAARYGGEEFAIVLPETHLGDAIALCERLRVAVAKYDWFKLQPELKVTLSFGVAANTELVSAVDSSNTSDSSQRNEPALQQVRGVRTPVVHEQILSLADQRLYRAKSEGRNRVVGESLPGSAKP
jgi:diguanylate cyclase (GGDEF)-like protein